MNSFERKMRNRLRLHPEQWQNLLAVPNEETLRIIVNLNLFDVPSPALASSLFAVIPLWEVLACEGSDTLARLIKLLETGRLSPVPSQEQALRTNLQRLRVLAATPGIFPFSPQSIQENLSKFLECADVLADLPEFKVISFTRDEIAPLDSELKRYRLNPLSRRYVQNLFHRNRREAILSVLAYIGKNYPLLGTCRQAYALILSLDNPERWDKHPFCLRLIVNRFWEYQVEADNQ